MQKLVLLILTKFSMSNTYKLTEKHQLTAEIHNLINQINQKTGKELRVESDKILLQYQYDDYPGLDDAGWTYAWVELDKTKMKFFVKKLGGGEEDIIYVCPTFTAENIQRLLCELDFKNNSIDLSTEQTFEFTTVWELDKKWFCLREETKEALLLSNPPQKPQPKATLSLWNSGEEGQIQVLTELKEVLENYLKN
jgi:hypothetical protein